MKKPPNRDKIINIGFYGGLAIKFLNALMEFAGGFLMLILSHDSLNRLVWLVAAPELKEDPNDIIMNYFISLCQGLSISSQHKVAVYMLMHGITKITVILLLWNKKLWSYPPSVVIFGLFASYEIYKYFYGNSLLLLLLIIIDVAMIVIIILEYNRLKTKKFKIM